MTLSRRIATATFAFLFALLLIPTASMAQASDGADAQAQRVRTQVSSLLNSSNADIQKQGIQLVVHYAESGTFDQKDESLRNELYDVYADQDRNTDVRLAALNALDRMGATKVMASRIVRDLRDEPSADVRQNTLRMLSKYNAAGS